MLNLDYKVYMKALIICILGKKNKINVYVDLLEGKNMTYACNIYI